VGAGAGIGTAIFPGVGTAVGAGIGLAAGAYLTYKGIDLVFNKKSKASGKEKASDIPSFAEGESCNPGESTKDATNRILDKYGRPRKTGPGSDFSKIKKYLDRKRKLSR